MTTIEQLKELRDDATITCKLRGHRMIWNGTDFKKKGRTTQSGICHDCLKSVYLDTMPPPNGIDVSGEAVALNCNT